MHFLPALCIGFLGFIVLIDSNVAPLKNGLDIATLNCSKFKRDLDILRTFSYSVQLNPLITTSKTYAVMNDLSQIQELQIFNEINLPLDVFCLVNLHTLRVNGTPFVSPFELDDNSISTGLSPLISHLTRLRVLSLINTTASYFPHHALSVLTNLTYLEIENCGLREIPHTISSLINLQYLLLSNNHLSSLPDSNGPTEGINSLKKLVQIDLSRNRLQSIDPLCNLTTLTYLNASNNIIEDISDLGDIASKVLYSIDLSNNQIDHIPPQINRFASSLRLLYLNNNKLAYLPTDIFRLKSLVQAHIRNNPFPTAEITLIKSKFRTDLPSCVLTA